MMGSRARRWAGSHGPLLQAVAGVSPRVTCAARALGIAQLEGDLDCFLEGGEWV